MSVEVTGISDGDQLIEALTAIRLSITPGARMLIKDVPCNRKQQRILREAVSEIKRLRKAVSEKPKKRAWYE